MDFYYISDTNKKTGMNARIREVYYCFTTSDILFESKHAVNDKKKFFIFKI